MELEQQDLKPLELEHQDLNALELERWDLKALELEHQDLKALELEKWDFGDLEIIRLRVRALGNRELGFLETLELDDLHLEAFELKNWDFWIPWNRGTKNYRILNRRICHKTRPQKHRNEIHSNFYRTVAPSAPLLDKFRNIVRIPITGQYKRQILSPHSSSTSLQDCATQKSLGEEWRNATPLFCNSDNVSIQTDRTSVLVL